MADIGIVIVTYNSGEEIGACLDAAAGSGAEIVVVDNASCDGTVERVRQRGVRILTNQTNRGFAAAVNQGFAVLKTPYVVLLNPDAVLLGGLDALREACDLPNAAGAGGKLLDGAGQAQIGFMVRQLPRPGNLILEALVLNRVWPRNPWNRRYRVLDGDYSSRFPVEQPAGAFLMIRRNVWEELGGLDEGYFPLWFEDVDFCKCAVDRGYCFYYVPHAVAKHTGGHSIRRITVELRRFYWYRSLLRYSARHFRPRSYRAVCAAVVTGSIVRGFAEAFFHRSLKPLVVYAQVVRLAGRGLIFGWRDAPIIPGNQ